MLESWCACAVCLFANHFQRLQNNLWISPLGAHLEPLSGYVLPVSADQCLNCRWAWRSRYLLALSSWLSSCSRAPWGPGLPPWPRSLTTIPSLWPFPLPVFSYSVAAFEHKWSSARAITTPVRHLFIVAKVMLSPWGLGRRIYIAGPSDWPQELRWHRRGVQYNLQLVCFGGARQIIWWMSQLRIRTSCLCRTLWRQSIPGSQCLHPRSWSALTRAGISHISELDQPEASNTSKIGSGPRRAWPYP